MRTVPLITIPCILIVQILVYSPVAASSDLVWGVEVGDESPYVLERKLVSGAFSEYMENFTNFLDKADEGQRIIIRVDHLDSIPDTLNTTERMPQANCTLMRENDSEIIMEDMQMMAVPVGIWDVQNQEVNSSFPGEIEYIDTADEWGTVIRGEFWMAIVIKIDMQFETTYYKSNGSLSRLWIRVNVAGVPNIDILLAHWSPPTNSDTSPIINASTITNTTMEPQGIAIVKVAVVGVSGIGCMFLMYMIYSKRKPKATGENI